MKKFTIYMNSGNVLATYLNIGLACDYRILADNAVIQNPGLDMGLAAKGGGAYFLPRLVGPKRTWNIMLSDNDITSFEAIDMGLVHEIAPSEHILEIGFRRAEEYAQKPLSALSVIKQLMHFSTRDLHRYLEYEDKLLINLIHKHEFTKIINRT